MYFLRWTNNPQNDIERNYSFDSYRLYDSVEEVVEEYGLEESDYVVAEYGDNMAWYRTWHPGKVIIAPANPEGTLWGIALTGLCAEKSAETIEEAEALAETCRYSVGELWLFEGEELNEEVYDGVAFKAKRVIKRLL